MVDFDDLDLSQRVLFCCFHRKEDLLDHFSILGLEQFIGLRLGVISLDQNSPLQRAALHIVISVILNDQLFAEGSVRQNVAVEWLDSYKWSA